MNKDIHKVQQLKQSISYYTVLAIAIGLLLFSSYCTPSTTPVSKTNNNSSIPYEKSTAKGALLSTQYPSLASLKKEIKIEYQNRNSKPVFFGKKRAVRLTHDSFNETMVSVLQSGVSEVDLSNAKKGDLSAQFELLVKVPYFVRNRADLQGVLTLSRRDPLKFKVGDIAFYHLAEIMLFHISDEDLAVTNSKDLTEKGYINTFNHVTAQAIMTTLFSEKLADFVADVHERKNMPELVSGKFSEKQLNDLQTGPVDNYVDMINNEWGQQIGQDLKSKYNITRETHWSPMLLANFLNDIQAYFSWAFGIGFSPFLPSDEQVILFSTKINYVMST